MCSIKSLTLDLKNNFPWLNFTLKQLISTQPNTLCIRKTKTRNLDFKTITLFKIFLCSSLQKNAGNDGRRYIGDYFFLLKKISTS